MKVKLLRSYRSRNGNVVFVYAVTGSAAQIEAYKVSMGENLREDESGNPLWFTTRCIGQTGSLIITTNGNVVPDMSKYDQAASLAAQYGGNFGAELAKAAAQSLIGGRVETPETPVEKAPEKSDDKLDEM